MEQPKYPIISARAGYKIDIIMGVGIKTRGWNIDYGYNHLNTIYNIDKQFQMQNIDFRWLPFWSKEKTIIEKKQRRQSSLFHHPNMINQLI